MFASTCSGVLSANLNGSRESDKLLIGACPDEATVVSGPSGWLVEGNKWSEEPYSYFICVQFSHLEDIALMSSKQSRDFDGDTGDSR